MSTGGSTSVVVTGAAHGVGFEIAAQLVTDGWFVVGLDRDLVALAAAATELGTRFLAVDGDVTVRADHERAASLARAAALLQGWVNAAATSSGSGHATMAQLGALVGCSVAVHGWLTARRQGSIVNLTNRVPLRGVPYGSVQASVRAALEAATARLAADHSHLGIRVNSVRPEAMATHPSPGSIGRTVAFLLSPSAAGITGESLSADEFDVDDLALDQATA